MITFHHVSYVPHSWLSSIRFWPICIVYAPHQRSTIHNIYVRWWSIMHDPHYWSMITRNWRWATCTIHDSYPLWTIHFAAVCLIKPLIRESYPRYWLYVSQVHYSWSMWSRIHVGHPWSVLANHVPWKRSMVHAVSLWSISNIYAPYTCSMTRIYLQWPTLTIYDPY